MKEENKDLIDATENTDNKQGNETDPKNHRQAVTVEDYNVLEEERDKDDQRGGPTP